MTRRSLFATLAAAITGRKLLPAAAFVQPTLDELAAALPIVSSFDAPAGILNLLLDIDTFGSEVTINGHIVCTVTRSLVAVPFRKTGSVEIEIVGKGNYRIHDWYAELAPLPDYLTDPADWLLTVH